MKPNTLRRMGALALSVLLCLTLCVPALGAETTIYLRSEEDLLQLSRQCRLDTWSKDKRVVLQRDIFLGDTDFDGIPLFSGVFDGNGHSITGWTMEKSGAPAGFISILQSGGVVEDLHVEGNVLPAGDAQTVGGIVGINHGTVSRCSFTGMVKGDHTVGGIVGENALTGTVIACRTQGGVFARGMTGGIVGANHGSVNNCVSVAYVNTEAEDPDIALGEMSFNLRPDPQLLRLTTDSGGIVGFSDGMVLGCTHNGSVGYQHVGYNVGGIVGRNRGFVSDCANHGEICGRKEVGGIVGQAEPYVVTHISGHSLESIRSELRTLSRMVDRAAQDAEGTSDTISARLSHINKNLTDTADGVDALGNALTGYADDTVTEINRVGEVIDHTAGELSDIADQLPAISQKVERALSWVESAMGRLEGAGASGSAAMEKLKAASSDLEIAARLLEEGGAKVDAGLKKISSAVETEDKTDGGDEQEGDKGALGELEEIIKKNEIQSVDYAAIKAGIQDISDGIEIMANGDAQSGSKGAGALIRSAAGHLKEGLDDLSSAVSALTAAAGDARSAMDVLGNVSADLTDVLDDLSALADYLDSVDPLHFSVLSDRTERITQSLHETMQDMSSELELLNRDANTSSQRLIEDLRGINDQFTLVLELLVDEAEDLESISPSQRVQDTSDKDIEAVTMGKLLRCTNDGPVYGDLDVGGIVGSMGIYNKVDPEEDGVGELSDTLRKRYELKAVLQACTNSGTVTAKRNYAGSVCGLAKLGVITDCRAYGEVISEGGSYVGGLAGGCNMRIRNSYAKCTLSGEKYVGGIFGGIEEGEDPAAIVSGCVSLVSITQAEQYAGAIAGEDAGVFQNNCFVSDTLGGLDRMSYVGRAEPLDYETLISREKLPAPFRRFELSFRADGKKIAVVPFQYGESFDASVFPQIPSQEGMYGVWDREDLRDLRFDTVVTAEYYPYVTTLPSTAKREDGRVVFLAEGAFNGEDRLLAEPVIADFEAAAKGVWDTLQSYRRELVEQWRVRIPGEGEHTVRYLMPESKHRQMRIYALEGETWQELDCQRIGTYMAFSAPSGEVYLTVLQSSTTWWIWLVIGVFLALMLVLVIRYHALSRLYRRAADRVAQREAAVAALPPKQRRRRNLALALLALLALMCLSVALIVHYVPGVKTGVEVYRSLKSYELRDELDLKLTVRASEGGRTAEQVLPISLTKAGDRRVACVDLRGTTFYLCNGHLILEDGTAYGAEGLLPDGEALLRKATTLFQTMRPSVLEDGETYRVTAGEEDGLLALLVPQWNGALSTSGEVGVELVTQKGQPSLLRFLWSGTLQGGEEATLEAELSLDVEQTGRTLPLTVASAAVGDFENAMELTQAQQEALLALVRRAGEDPLSATVSIRANCGPVLVNESARLDYTLQGEKEVLRLKKGLLTLYATRDAACTPEGEATKNALSSLLPALYQATLHTSSKSVGSKVLYATALEDGEMEALLTAILPEADRAYLSVSSGVLEAEVREGTLYSLSAQWEGSAKVALTEVPGSFRVSVTFDEARNTTALPEKVVEFLLPSET